jgi:signal transduction histidine kinase/CheY-like chemotaxis protein
VLIRGSIWEAIVNTASVDVRLSRKGPAFPGELEDAFLKEFRGTALKWAAYACLAAALLFTAFFFIESISEGAIREVQYLRGGLAACLLLLALALWLRRGVTIKNYVLIAGLGSTLALAGTFAILMFPGRSELMVALQAAPGMIFGLFLHYSLLRLPFRLSAIIGVLMSVGAVLCAPSMIVEGDLVRYAVYLAFANVFGLVICHLIESRERELFFQRRRAESAQSEARERQLAAEESDREKTRLIAAVSHDLRQPMMAAVAHLDVLKARIDRRDTDGVLEQARKAQSAVSILGTTLDHLLTAARYDSGTEPLCVEIVDLSSILRELYDAYVPEAEQRGVELRIRMPRDRVMISTDRRSVLRILSNLISNAIKFTDRKPGRSSGVVVVARLQGSTCRIDVVDTGIGIAPANREEVWKPYVQLNNVERDRERGLGLGLFLVQRIVEQLPNHSVLMRSTVGRGSRFTLTLPGIRANAGEVLRPVAEPLCSMPELTPLLGAYVLLVEDDLDARIAIAELLKEWGVIVTAGATITDVLESDESIDLIVDALVCDYRLAGGVTGIAAIARIRARLGYSPHAVLITGEASIEPLQARVERDTTVLRKPFQPEAFAASLLASVRSTRNLEVD